MWQKIIAGLVVLLLAAPGMVQAIDDTAAPKQIDRARLSHSFRNTGTQGGLYDPGSQAYGGRESGSMHYPFVFTGGQARGFSRDLDSDNSRGEGVWTMAKDASGTLSSPISRNTSRAAESCPFPPSINTRSGKMPQLASLLLVPLSSGRFPLARASAILLNRRLSTSRMLSKSSTPSTVFILKRRYSEDLGLPSSKTAMLATVLVP